MKIYVASSWRNLYQPAMVEKLRAADYEVYDFRHPNTDDPGFAWSDIDPAWQGWTLEQYRDNLEHPIAEAGFQSDMDALKWCDAVVAVQPFGISASLELGWAVGAGKITILKLDTGEPELMVKMCDHICCTTDEVFEVLESARKYH